MVNYSILLPTGRLLDVVDEQVGFTLGTECAQNEGVACSKGQRSRGESLELIATKIYSWENTSLPQVISGSLVCFQLRFEWRVFEISC